MNTLDRYNIYIKEKYESLVKSGNEIDNYNLSKIFEYYSCIQLTEKYNQEFREYDDIHPEFKEQNKMSRNDTGIDACNLIDTIVQCKLRKDTLTWGQCSTFFGSQNVFDSTLKKTIVRWNNLIITRNKESQLSKNFKEKQELFTDITYSRDEIINYCNSLLKNPPVIKINKEEPFKLRDYQLESIELIKNNGNVIISLPTGSGKNIVIIFSMSENKRYLILVPRIILMNQIKTEIIKHKPEFKNKIQTIGDSHNYYDETKDITICVYNSVSIIENYCDSFDKIFIDEAHHINIPEIYKIDDDIDDIDDIETNEESDGSDYETDYETDEEIDEETESILKDDTEDEIKNTTGYNKIIKSLSKYNNNVYLSATIDEIKDFTYYKKDIRDMINNKYLCDYTINIPIFSDDPSDKNICEYLINNYINIIVYCNSQKEGKKINKLLNTLQKGCSEYIDCKTPKKKRDTIINEYKKGEIKFLVNVRILVEGFDAPITKGVYFIHLPTSKTTIIQIMGRALRLHPLKTIANIILPFSSNDEGVNINKFLKILALNDTRIRKSYESKNNGGYISIIKIKDDDDDNDDEEDNKDIEFRYEMIYDSMGILKNGNEIWINKLELIKNYIDENKKRPSQHDKNKEVKIHGVWISGQVHNYKNKKHNMLDENIRKLWEDFINDDKYKKYFFSNEEEWKLKLEWVKKYIDENKKRPTKEDKNEDIKTHGRWIGSQVKNYQKKKYIMSNETIIKLWEDFINDNKYKEYFLSNEEEWKLKLEWVKKYIDENKKRPSNSDKNKNIKTYYNWISQQLEKYKNKKENMSVLNIRKLWEDFINDDKYKEYFICNKEVWKSNLEWVKKYIDENKKRPSIHDKNKDIKIYGSWIGSQIQRYKKKKEIMLDETIRKLWEYFINDDKYKEYFLSNEEVWKLNLEWVKKYIDENKKKPSDDDKNKDVKTYGKWISHQVTNYQKKDKSMSASNIIKLWEDFINDDKYKKYFISNKEVWNLNLEWVKKYIDENKKRPSSTDKNKDIKIHGSWICNQLQNYQKKEHIMLDETIQKLWEDFINDDKYKEYFLSNEEVWKLKLEWVKKYINKNKKRPSTTDKNNDVKIYGSWISHQQQNYQKKEQIMLDDNIRKLWEDFINDDKYKEYF